MKFFRAILGLFVATLVAAVIIGNSPYRPIREIFTQVTIDAPSERVWAILTDTARYPEWNPFLTSVSGDLRVGNTVSVRFRTPNSRFAKPIWPKVLAVETNRELRWRGVALIPGLFSGEHSFEIVPTGPNSCRFIQRETYSGSLVPLAWRWITTDLIAGFRSMNDALKTRAKQK
jgi:hypothetical protein